VHVVAQGHLGIFPFSLKSVQPAGYDLHLGSQLREYMRDVRWQGHGLEYEYKDQEPQYPDRDNSKFFQLIDIPEDGYVLYPGYCVLGSTQERLRLPNNIVGKLEGVSTNARIFLIVHATAGHFDQEFEGEGTLEIVNLSPRPTILTVGMRVAQMIFHWTEVTDTGYMGRYQYQTGPTASRDPKNA
jgi:dCTP deaminase